MNYLHKLGYDGNTFIISGSLVEAEIVDLVEIFANEYTLQEDYDSVITFLAEQEEIKWVEEVEDICFIDVDDIIKNA